MDALFLTLDEVREIHEQQIERYGGSHGVRDTGRPGVRTRDATGYFRWRIPASYDRGDGCSVSFSITQNHPFIDGNKRTGANAAITFLNNLEPTFSEDQLVEMVLGVAQGRVGKNEIARFFAGNCRPLR